MSNDAKKVTTGKPRVGGATFRAPIGTVLPTDASSELGSEFTCLGYCSEDGLSNDLALSTESIKAWGGDTVLVTQTEKADTFSFTLIEGLNPDVLATVHGEENVSGTLAEGLTVKVNNSPQSDYVWVFDMIMRGNVLKRVVLPCAAVTSIEEVSYNDSDAVGYGITLTAVCDTNGNSHYEYFKNSTAAAQNGGE